MRKTTKIILFILLIITVAIIGLVRPNIFNDSQGKQLNESNDKKDSGVYNTTYRINNELVALVNGVSAEEAAPGSASKIITQYFGNETSVDINDDNREDMIFLLTQETEGTGTFFYIVASLNTPEGWNGSNALFLGDRITPQTIELSKEPSHENVIIVNYLDRKLDEPMTTEPSIEKTILLKFDTENMSFGEVEQNFEGEAAPKVMTLDMKSWQWIKTSYNNDTEVTPSNSKDFSITFNSNGTFSATTDCNSLNGEYTLDNNHIAFGENMIMTMMFCENSQEQEFISLLGQVQSFFFTNKGELIFDLKFDSGSAIFR